MPNPKRAKVESSDRTTGLCEDPGFVPGCSTCARHTERGGGFSRLCEDCGNAIFFRTGAASRAYLHSRSDYCAKSKLDRVQGCRSAPCKCEN